MPIKLTQPQVCSPDRTAGEGGGNTSSLGDFSPRVQHSHNHHSVAPVAKHLLSRIHRPRLETPASLRRPECNRLVGGSPLAWGSAKHSLPVEVPTCPQTRVPGGRARRPDRHLGGTGHTARPSAEGPGPPGRWRPLRKSSRAEPLPPPQQGSPSAGCGGAAVRTMQTAPGSAPRKSTAHGWGRTAGVCTQGGLDSRDSGERGCRRAGPRRPSPSGHLAPPQNRTAPGACFQGPVLRRGRDRGGGCRPGAWSGSGGPGRCHQARRQTGSREASGGQGPPGPRGKLGKPAEALSSSPRDADRSGQQGQDRPRHSTCTCSANPLPLLPEWGKAILKGLEELREPFLPDPLVMPIVQGPGDSLARPPCVTEKESGVQETVCPHLSQPPCPPSPGTTPSLQTASQGPANAARR